MLTFFKRKSASIKGLFKTLGLKKENLISLGSVLESQAEKYGDKPLIFFKDKSISYKEFNELANQYAHLFLSLGFKKKDTVVLFMENRPQYLIAHAGLSKIGVVPALVNTNIRKKVLAHAFNIVEPKGAIIGGELLDFYNEAKNEINSKDSGFTFVENNGFKQELSSDLKDISGHLKNMPKRNPNTTSSIFAGDLLEYIYTSGTTGFPKATSLIHHKWIQLGYGAGGFCLGALPNDVQYCCLPLYHNSGINIAWSTSLISGGTFALAKKFSASNFWNDIKKYNASLFIYIGELCRYLNNQPESEKDKDNPLLYILGNGMRKDYWTEFKNRFGIKKIVEVYGATEGVGALTNSKGIPGMIGKLNLAWQRVGEVVKYDIEENKIIRDKNGFAVKCRPGETGMFLAKISAKSPFIGYKGNQKATNEKILTRVFQKNDAYFVSGDLFKLHKKGYVSFVDRLGDTFKWKGEVVATNEVADVLNSFEGIEDNNVYGVEVNMAEGRCGMVAVTMLESIEFDPEKFGSFVCSSLPVYARPYFVRIRKEKDATASFKQVKTHLKKEGFDPLKTDDQLFFLNPENWKYINLDSDLYEKIQSGQIKF